MNCKDENLWTSDMHVMRRWQSLVANTFKGSYDHLSFYVSEYTYMYAMGRMSENLSVTGVNVEL